MNCMREKKSQLRPKDCLWNRHVDAGCANTILTDIEFEDKPKSMLSHLSHFSLLVQTILHSPFNFPYTIHASKQRSMHCRNQKKIASNLYLMKVFIFIEWNCSKQCWWIAIEFMKRNAIEEVSEKPIWNTSQLIYQNAQK